MWEVSASPGMNSKEDGTVQEREQGSQIGSPVPYSTTWQAKNYSAVAVSFFFVFGT